MATSRGARLSAVLIVVIALAGTSAYAQQATEDPVRVNKVTEGTPSRSHGYLAWQREGRAVIVKPDGASTFKIGRKTAMGSLDGKRLIYQKYDNATGKSSIWVMNLDTRRSRKIGGGINTRRWEFWPRADLPWVMFGRVTGSKQKLMLVNVKTGSSRVLDSAGLRVYLRPGQINGDYVVWNFYRRGSKAKVKRHRISTGNTQTLPTGDRNNWGPSVTDQGTTYFGRSNRLCGGNAGIFRAAVGENPTEVVGFPRDFDMATSWAYKTSEGAIEVYYDRSKCATNDSAVDNTDIYKVVDPFVVTLTVAVSAQGNATGTVTGRGINCGTDCTQILEPGARVTLTATPAEGDSFDSWSDASCGSQPTCTITITADTTITATFRQ